MNHTNKFQELIKLDYINSSTESIVNLFEDLTKHSAQVIPNIWFYANFQTNDVANSERHIDFNLEELIRGNGYVYVCRLYDSELTIDPIIINYFSQFIQCTDLTNIKSIQLFIMNNIEILPHTDSDDQTLTRVLIPIEVPKNNGTNIGFKIEDCITVPTSKIPIGFDGSKSHSAWNFTHVDWKFLSVDYYDLHKL